MVKYLIIHHCGGSDLNPLLDTSNQTFEIVNEYHRQKWDFKSNLGYYIGYQYFIDKTGKVTQGREDIEEGAHTIGYNKESIGICLAGNFDVTMPTEAQITALKMLLHRLSAKYNVPLENIIPHRAKANKSCYGRNLSDDWARKLIEVQKPIEPCTSERDVIKLQEKKISNLESFISVLLNYFKK